MVHTRYVRHRSFARVRHSKELLDFLDEQGTRLSATFTPTDVTADTTDVLTATAHGFTTGEGPFVVVNSGGALPGGITADTLYWVNVIDANTFTLHPTEQDAIDNTNTVDVTSAGSGTNSLERMVQPSEIFNLLLNGNTAEEVQGLSSLP